MIRFFFFNDTATTEIYTLSLHDALPIYVNIFVEVKPVLMERRPLVTAWRRFKKKQDERSNCKDRKSTRLNSSHGYISYAVFCLKKKKKQAPNLHSNLIHTELYHRVTVST